MKEKEFKRIQEAIPQKAGISTAEGYVITILADQARQLTIANEQLTRIANALQKKMPVQQQREAMGNG